MRSLWISPGKYKVRIRGRDHKLQEDENLKREARHMCSVGSLLESVEGDSRPVCVHCSTKRNQRQYENFNPGTKGSSHSANRLVVSEGGAIERKVVRQLLASLYHIPTNSSQTARPIYMFAAL